MSWLPVPTTILLRKVAELRVVMIYFELFWVELNCSVQYGQYGIRQTKQDETGQYRQMIEQQQEQDELCNV